jgi:hypothetical protein
VAKAANGILAFCLLRLSLTCLPSIDSNSCQPIPRKNPSEQLMFVPPTLTCLPSIDSNSGLLTELWLPPPTLPDPAPTFFFSFLPPE